MSLLQKVVGEKSRLTLLGEAAEIKHRAWHVESLQAGRKRQWRDEAVAALEAAKTRLAEKEDAPIDEETGQIVDTSAEAAEVARLQRAVEKHQDAVNAAELKVAALASAKNQAAAALGVETFLRGPLENMHKALLAVHEAHQEMIKSPYGGEFSIPWLNDELITSWSARKELRTNPSIKPEPKPTTVVVFVKDYLRSNIGGGGYVAGDAAGWAPEHCAELIAKGFAEWCTPTPEGEALVAAARKRLAVLDSAAGEPRVNVEVGAGMAAAANG